MNVNRYQTLHNFYKPFLSGHPLLSGHLERSRRSPVNRGFTVINYLNAIVTPWDFSLRVPVWIFNLINWRKTKTPLSENFFQWEIFFLQRKQVTGRKVKNSCRRVLRVRTLPGWLTFVSYWETNVKQPVSSGVLSPSWSFKAIEKKEKKYIYIYSYSFNTYQLI